ncbi:ATP12 family chaperone protein [Thalassobaculum litoreum]|uniref:Chaperone required for the assembly of the F1-ATPase n=1 Tax=Thalassobaculum litoreum DSM 18839 TaxID=1123362 RepID=A0A8G2BLZ8_9PROT|nr:ATP12 family protein [Thalassobaculum litoreum]SDG47182.1 Chaperone required for the assembly of the F1-ATPase [Thalassobaculum litoreum DSM 18839]
MKRFYKTVAVSEADDGAFLVTLDDRNLSSPAKRPLRLPTRGVAEAIAEEWDAQGEKIDPSSMAMMSFAATVTDRVTPQRDHVVGEIAGFGGSDLLCFLADGPDELVGRQVTQWTPWRERAEKRLAMRLVVTSGVMPVRQSEEALAAFRASVEAVDDWSLAPLHTATSITGSLILALAFLDGDLGAAEAFGLSQVDEAFQVEKWGQDREAELRRRGLLAEMKAAERFKTLVSGER